MKTSDLLATLEFMSLQGYHINVSNIHDKHEWMCELELEHVYIEGTGDSPIKAIESALKRLRQP